MFKAKTKKITLIKLAFIASIAILQYFIQSRLKIGRMDSVLVLAVGIKMQFYFMAANKVQRTQKIRMIIMMRITILMIKRTNNAKKGLNFAYSAHTS